MFTYLPLPVDDKVPEGYRLIVAYAKNDMVVIPVEPTVLPDDQHNCDWEGCCTLSHVVRFSISHKYEMEARLEAAEAGKHQATQTVRKPEEQASAHS